MVNALTHFGNLRIATQKDTTHMERNLKETERREPKNGWVHGPGFRTVAAAHMSERVERVKVTKGAFEVSWRESEKEKPKILKLKANR